MRRAEPELGLGNLHLPSGELGVDVVQIAERPAWAKLRLTYLTPDSTLPFVRAQYGWQSRGVKRQGATNAANVELAGVNYPGQTQLWPPS